jgi:hypothetical protein
MQFSLEAISRLAMSLLAPVVVSSVVALFSLPTCPAFAVLLATGTGDTTAPNPDPGFNRLGVVNGLSAVYFRNGWVLTASHVGTETFWLATTGYAPVPGSTVRFSNPDSSLADLIAFKLATRPPLADIALADTPPSVSTLVTLVGHGVDRGTATSWMGIGGWTWGGSSTMRWGTNRISWVRDVALSTQAFRTTFDDIPNPAAGEQEADVVVGDSGGGAFTGTGSTAKLVGILFARSTYGGQPANTSLYGNDGLIVDLFAYRNDILAVVDRPDCNDGLDEDGDGLVDYPSDPGCAYAGDFSERGVGYQCDNGVDDDGDSAIDFPSDAGCLHPSNKIEAPEPGVGLSLAFGVLVIAAGAIGRRRGR